MRTQGDIIQHHCLQLASVGSWGERKLIIRPDVFKSKGKNNYVTLYRCMQSGLDGLSAPSDGVDAAVNDVTNLAKSIAVHKEQYLTDKLAETPDTIIYTPHDTELVTQQLEAGDYYNLQRLCGLILITDSDHLDMHFNYDAIVSRETESIVEAFFDILGGMIPDRNANQAEQGGQGRTWS